MLTKFTYYLHTMFTVDASIPGGADRRAPRRRAAGSSPLRPHTCTRETNEVSIAVLTVFTIDASIPGGADARAPATAPPRRRAQLGLAGRVAPAARRRAPARAARAPRLQHARAAPARLAPARRAVAVAHVLTL